MEGKGRPADIYYLKGLCERLFELVGLQFPGWTRTEISHDKLTTALAAAVGELILLEVGAVDLKVVKKFDIRQPVLFADFRWDSAMTLASARKIEFRELPRQLPVYRDLAMIVGKSLPWQEVEAAIRSTRLDKLHDIRLFDIFESEKLGSGKKSMALSLTFLDEEKTLTDKEIDGMVARIMIALEKEVHAEIRK